MNVRTTLALCLSLTAMAAAQDDVRYHVYFGDLHSHTTFSPDARIHFGARHYEDPGWACVQARQNGLDFVAVTDHDFALGARHWQMAQEQLERNYQPGRFTTFIGYEWTSMTSTISYGDESYTFRNGHGHRCVIFNGSEVPSQVFRCIDPRYDEPKELWDALAEWKRLHPGTDVLTIPHSPMSDEYVEHDTSNGTIILHGDQTVNWDEVDGRFQTLVEIFSKHGSSEGPDGLEKTDPARFEATLADLESGDHDRLQSAMRTWYLPVESFGTYADHSVQTALNRWLDPAQANRDAYKLGIIASTDDHTAKPGSVDEDRTEISWPCHGGLVAVHAEGNTREQIWEALRARRVYGTSGAKIVLWFEVVTDRGRGCMGSTLASGTRPLLLMRARGENGHRIARFDVIKNGVLYAQVTPVGRLGEFRATFVDPTFDANAYYYVRAVQEDTRTWYRSDFDLNGAPMEKYSLGERAWSSPVWVEKAR